MCFRSGQPVQSVGFDPFGQARFIRRIQPFQLLKCCHQVGTDAQQPVTARSDQNLRRLLEWVNSQMTLQCSESCIQSSPALLAPALTDAEWQQPQFPFVVGLCEVVGRPEGQLRHPRLQWCHFSGEVVGGALRCHQQVMTALN